MIPVMQFNIGSVYTFILNGGRIVRGTLSASSQGKLFVTGAAMYERDLSLAEKNDSIGIDYTDIIGAGFCSDERFLARNTLCWELNLL